MGWRTYGNPPLLSTTAFTQSNPSTATLCAELIIPVTTGDTSACDNYEVRFGVGASTSALWRLDCAASSVLSSAGLRANTYGTGQRVQVYTGTGQSAEYVVTFRAAQGDRFRATLESTWTGTAAAWIQAEVIS